MEALVKGDSRLPRQTNMAGGATSCLSKRHRWMSTYQNGFLTHTWSRLQLYFCILMWASLSTNSDSVSLSNASASVSNATGVPSDTADIGSPVSTRPWSTDPSPKHQEGGNGIDGLRQKTPPPTTLSPLQARYSCANRTCASQDDVECHVTKRSSFCIHRDVAGTDFPDKPRDLKINYTPFGKDAFLNISWKAPHDYSYRAVTGYEVHVSSFLPFDQEVHCYFVNLSTVSWDQIHNVHDVVYYLDCFHVPAVFSMVHVKVFSYPKPKWDTKGTKSTELWFHRPESVSWKWNPDISFAQVQESKSLMITVAPIVPPIATFRVCVRHILQCYGTVIEVGSPENMSRYKVTDLLANTSYHVCVLPLTENGSEVENYVCKENPIILEPWREGSTTTLEPESSSRFEPEEEAEGVAVELVVALLFVVALAVGTVCCLWRKGYLQKSKLLNCCFLKSSNISAPINVVQLYVPESEEFQLLVHKHMDLLSQLTGGRMDCTHLHHGTNPDYWIDRLCSNHRLLIYVSPQLMAELRSMEANAGRQLGDSASSSTHPHSYTARKFAQIICRSANSDSRLKKLFARKDGGGGCRSRMVFVFSGCFASDVEDEQWLHQSPSLGGLQCFWVVDKSRLQLRCPSAILSTLSGSHHTFVSSDDWDHSSQAEDLCQAVNQLLLTLPGSQDFWGGTNGFRGRRVDGGDSGFSSAIRSSNPSSKSNSSPRGSGEDYSEDMVKESDPMLQAADSASQHFILFQPPELPLETDSFMLTEAMRGVNDRDKWSYN